MLTVPPMAMPARAARLFVIASTALSLSGCQVLGWDCGTVASTLANGTVRDATDAALATVQVILAEDVPLRLRLSVGVMGPGGSAGAPLRGHVTRARLVTGAGALLADVPTGTSTLYIDAVVALPQMDLPSRNEYNRVRSELHTAKSKVVLETDLPGRELIETTLTDVHDEPGNVQRCSPA
jgi:hypothetical protein